MYHYQYSIQTKKIPFARWMIFYLEHYIKNTFLCCVFYGKNMRDGTYLSSDSMGKRLWEYCRFVGKVAAVEEHCGCVIRVKEPLAHPPKRPLHEPRWQLRLRHSRTLLPYVLHMEGWGHKILRTLTAKKIPSAECNSKSIVYYTR